MKTLTLLFLILLVTSCTKNENDPVKQQYIYSEIVYESYIINGNKEKFIKNVDTIEALTPMEAYSIAEEKFNETKIIDKQTLNITGGTKKFINGNVGVWYSETIEFKLTDINGREIKKDKRK